MGLFRGPAIVNDGLLSAYDFASVKSYPYQASPGGTSPLLKLKKPPQYQILSLSCSYIIFKEEILLDWFLLKLTKSPIIFLSNTMSLFESKTFW